jgi:folylpolyglutamate synthase
MHTPAAFQRALKLCKPIAQSWAAVHVAGTNGKGSVCAYITKALIDSGVRCGTFTSPHLIDRYPAPRPSPASDSLSSDGTASASMAGL